MDKCHVNKRQRTPEKLATQGTKDEEKQSKNTTQYVLDTTHTNNYCIIFGGIVNGDNSDSRILNLG